MKICVPLRDPPSTNLREGNLRSESRWERQALEACTRNPMVTEVYTQGYAWNGDTSGKYRGLINPNAAMNTILLMQDWKINVVKELTYKAAVVNIFAGPWMQEQAETKSIIKDRYLGQVFFTLGFPILYETPDAISHLLNFVDRDHICLLPVPGIPEMPPKQNNFNKNLLFWAQRIIFTSDLKRPTILWALEKMNSNPDLRLRCLTGTEPQDLKALVDGKAVSRSGMNINDAFWLLECYQPYIHLRPRVEVLYSVSWQEALAMYSESKLYLAYHKHFGGPPLEASMYGVPFIGCGKNGVMANCPGYLYTNNEKDTNDLLDRLYSDEEFYIKTADAYRDYVSNNYTFEAFNNNLNRLLGDRGLL